MRTCGLVATYKAGCRCQDCRAAMRDEEQIRRDRYYAERVLVGGRLVAPAPAQHGSDYCCTMRGCRCDSCTAAHLARRRPRGVAA